MLWCDEDEMEVHLQKTEFCIVTTLKLGEIYHTISQLQSIYLIFNNNVFVCRRIVNAVACLHNLALNEADYLEDLKDLEENGPFSGNVELEGIGSDKLIEFKTTLFL